MHDKLVVDTVLFDLDGTLVDSLPDIADALRRTVCRKRPPDDQTVVHWIGHGVEPLVQRAMAFADIAEEEFSSARQDFASAYAANFCNRSCLYPFVADTLAALQLAGFRLGCVTNKSKQFTDPVLRELGLTDWIQVAISGDELAERKPHPLPIQTAMERLGGTSAVYVGDSQTDYASAQQADLPFVGLRYGYDSAAPLAEIAGICLLDDLRPLPAMLALA